MSAMDTHEHGGRSDVFTCRELARLITDYWEGALTPEDAARFEHHMSLCGPCEDYVEQLRLSTRTLAALRECEVSDATRAALFEMFRAWKEGRTAQ